MERRWIELDGKPMSYLEQGSGSPLLLVHAFPLSAEMWTPQLVGLPAGWRIIAPDVTGFGPAPDGGRAAAPVPGTSSVDAYAADLLGLMAVLGIRRAVIGGLSMGGYIAFAMFRRAPGCFDRIVLADTRAPADTEEGRAKRVEMVELLRREGPAAVAHAMLPKLLGETTRRERPELVAELWARIAAGSAAGIEAAIRSMMGRPDSTPLLSSIRCPALVIVGDEDVLTPVAEARALHAGLSDAALEILPGAGHLSNLERPAEFNAALARFLAGATAR